VRVNRFLTQHFMTPAPGGFAEEFRLGTEALAARGVTCAVDGHTLAAQAEAVRRLDAEGRLGCRVITHPATSWEGDLEDFQSSKFSFGEALGPLSRVGPLKILYDLFVMHRTALMTRPYRGEPHNFGRRNIPPDGLRTRLAAARERGFPAAIHVTGDRGAAEAVEALEAELAGRAPAGSLLIHAYFPPPELPEKMAGLGLGLAAQPVFLRHWAEALERLVGWERIGDFCPLDDYLAAGVAVAAGSDAPICDFDPLAGIHAMVTRCSLSGREWGPSHALARETALDLYTGAAARLFAWSGFPGRLEVGGPADFTVLDRDLATCAPDEILGAKVLATYVAGRETYRAGTGPAAGGTD
jgi:predicted amidohydrolase YtcJ